MGYTCGMPKPKRDKVYEVLTQIEDSLSKQNSIGRVFILGLFRGLGTALGATVLLALATSIAIQFSDAISVESLMEYFFDASVLD